MTTTYAELTAEDKARIEALWDEYSSRSFMRTTPEHMSACIANDIWPVDGRKARKVDSNRWAAVLTYLVFSGKIGCHFPA
jgi:hypothetical protein